MKIAVISLTLSLCYFATATRTTFSELNPPPRFLWKHRRWTAEEDATVIAFVKAAGVRPPWTEVAAHLNITARQVREHYYSRLDPNLKTAVRGKLTAKDDAFIVDFVEKAASTGSMPKWTVLGKLMRLPRHTVKSRYRVYLRQLARSTSHGSLTSFETADTQETQDSDKSTPIDDNSYLPDDDMLLFTFQDVPDFDEWMAMHDKDFASKYGIDKSEKRDGRDQDVDASDYDDLSSLLLSDDFNMHY